MKITIQLRNLKVGTLVYRNTGVIVIEQPYNTHTDSYMYRDLESEECGSVTPADLLGGEIF